MTGACEFVEYATVTGALGWLGETYGLTVPPEVEPVVVVLVFGVVTDYCVFFLDHVRRHLQDGLPGEEAAARAGGEVNGIVFVAAVVVALSTGALVVAELPFFRAFGPALALAVLLGAIVTITLLPCLLALLGRVALWPSVHRNAEAARPAGPPLRARVARFAVQQPVAAAVGSLLLLGLAAGGLLRYDVANPVIQSLPANSAPQRGYDVATTGFTADGIVAPTVAVVRQDGIAREPARLAELGLLLARQPGVTAVFGPGDVPPELEQIPEGVFVAPGGDLARYLIVFGADPLDEPAVGAVRDLVDRAPELVREAGLPDAELLIGGDTAISATLVERTLGDLRRVAPLALLAAFAVLAVYLRSLVAPLYLVATSVLALLAALGLSATASDVLLEPIAVAFFVPFAVSVLLLGLGSDYNVFLVGRIWDEGERRPLRDAVEVAATRAARPIATAGVILAGSFGLLALVPLTTFRAIALAMVIGLLLDAFLVRQLLVPALIVLVGPRSGWPGRRLSQAPARPGETTESAPTAGSDAGKTEGEPGEGDQPQDVPSDASQRAEPGAEQRS